jgi:hypothetical protein
LKTRYDSAAPNPDLLPAWVALSAGDVNWEGWFKVFSPPNASQTSLIGTSGANHDTEEFAIDGVPATRRRHGAVWIDNSGYISVSSNTGRSTGLLTGPNISDARWHHVAAIWRRSTGGSKVSLNFKVVNVDVLIMMTTEDLFYDIIGIAKTLIADRAKVTTGDVFVETWDDSVRLPGGYFRFGVNTTINAPANSDISDSLLRLSSRVVLLEQLSSAIKNRIMVLPNDAFPIKPAGTGDIAADFLTFPELQTTGSVQLFVDGIAQPGKITYDPGEDNLCQDGQLVVAGGYQSQPIHAEVQRFRIWSRALAPEELVIASQCRMPDPSTLFGGPFPHDLYADFKLDGSFSNEVGVTDLRTLHPSVKNNQSLFNAGEFRRGGRCNYDRCPEASEHGCPVMRNRQLNFNSTEACETFARFNFCRIAGSERGRPPYAYFDGCHRGGGDEIAEITL